MKKSDLKPGYVVQYRNGYLRIVAESVGGMVLCNDKGIACNYLKRYEDNLVCTDETEKNFDIIKIYGFGDIRYACKATVESRTLLWKREDEEELSISESTMLNDLAKEIHENAKAHGWYDDKRSFGEIVALCHSELSEALEQYRDNKPMAYFWNENDLFGTDDEITDLDVWTNEKLEGVAVEMIDCVIRIFDWCASENIDIDRLIRMKHEYNKSREYKHGGKLI